MKTKLYHFLLNSLIICLSIFVFSCSEEVTEHNDNFSVLDLLNCEYFYNIKNIVYKENVTEKKYTNFNYIEGGFGTINDDKIKGQWKRYKIHELINTKITSNVNSKQTTSSFTLLKELSDKIKKYPFRVIANFKNNDFIIFSKP